MFRRLDANGASHALCLTSGKMRQNVSSQASSGEGRKNDSPRLAYNNAGRRMWGKCMLAARLNKSGHAEKLFISF